MREADVADVNRAEQAETGEPVYPDGELKERIGAQRTRHAVAPAAEGIAADGEAAHEGGQGDRYREGRVAEDGRELAQPDDLVEERGDAGEEERDARAQCEPMQ